MLFLTSLVYILVAYVLLGQILIIKLAFYLNGGGKYLPAEAYWLLLNTALYVVIAIVLGWSKATYQDLQQVRQSSHKILKTYLDVNGCAWVNAVGLISVAAGTILLHWKDLLPLEAIPLCGAVLLGLVNVSAKTDLAEWGDERKEAESTDLPPAAEAVESVTTTVEWVWHFARKNGETLQPHTIKFDLSKADFSKANEAPRFPVELPKQWMRYVREGVTEDLKRVAEELHRKSKVMKLSKLQEAIMVTAVVRAIPHVSALPDGRIKQPKFPIETLYLQAGDDSDHALLAATLLTILEHQVALFVAVVSEKNTQVAVGYCPGPLAKHRALAGAFSRLDGSGDHYHYLDTGSSSSGTAAEDRAVLLFKDPDKIKFVTMKMT